jgi:hypothetical protein
LGAIEELGGADQWGVTKRHAAHLEPYSFAVKLVDKGFELLNAVAAATDVSRPFPAGKSTSELLNGPPENPTFQLKYSSRVDLLG